MAKGSGSGGPGGSGRRRDAAPRRAPKRTASAGAPQKKPVVFDARPAAGPAPSAALRLGLVPGATPGKWIDAWRDRLPDVPVEVTVLDVATQRERVLGEEIDIALVRLPIDDDGLHVIPLYDEIPVVVCASDSALTAADELDLADLAGEVVIVPRDAVYDFAVPGSIPPAFDAPADTAEAIATVAAGVGIVIVPLSLARLHHRKDAAHRPLRAGPTSTVALAWRSDRTTPEVEMFIGIVRGRTANSSRG
ncbi:LysR family substrate-binding domain-containing protein [Microbacterium rhizomatis]|uniref:Transcriptional regulator n=1 Tax=Microbacterium rhizomatis TaxID=1631477 RepID=A0A5J5IZX8_9MICO|nr:LysR family substrate-binding domain-containing protein [Microbacterium rhizomatis]KAA9107881.1 transcriptional regulator [Microbacterium rhizomatis]